MTIDIWPSSPGLTLLPERGRVPVPCTLSGGHLASAADKHGDIVLGKVDAQAQPELSEAFGIMSIPTLVILRDKVVLYTQPGALPEQALEGLIAKSRAPGMDDIDRRISERATSA